MAQTPLNAPVGMNYAHIPAATTTVVKAAPGYLASIIFNAIGTTATTVFDNTSAAVPTIGVITPVSPDAPGFPLTYGVNFKTGLTITTGAGADVTVVYR